MSMPLPTPVPDSTPVPVDTEEKISGSIVAYDGMVDSIRIQKKQEKYDGDVMSMMRACVEGQCNRTAPKD